MWIFLNLILQVAPQSGAVTPQNSVPPGKFNNNNGSGIICVLFSIIIRVPQKQNGGTTSYSVSHMDWNKMSLRPQINVLLELAGTCIIQRRKRRRLVFVNDYCSSRQEEVLLQGNSKNSDSIFKLRRISKNDNNNIIIITNNNTAPDHHYQQQHRGLRRCNQNEAQPERCSKLMCSSGTSLYHHRTNTLCQGVVVEQSIKMRKNFTY